MSLWNQKFQTNLDKETVIFSLRKLEEITKLPVKQLPYSFKVLLENILRNAHHVGFKETHLYDILNWDAHAKNQPYVPFIPARIVMQDFSGLPAMLDLVAMRNALQKEGGDPDRVNPIVDTTLVIDHSLQVDFAGTNSALKKNLELEFMRNQERYNLLRWAQQAFTNFQVVPPGTGIIHQINLEYLAKIIIKKNLAEQRVAYFDSVLGADSHTTMINAMGILGWGIGGIEAEAIMLGQPYYFVLPKVVGVKFEGQLAPGVNATDLVLHLTQKLRAMDLIDKYVEFYGPGVRLLSLPDRAVIANMVPEYGATIGLFPIDEETLRYYTLIHGVEDLSLIKAYCEHQYYWDDGISVPHYSETITIDLASITATMAGPKRPQDRVPFKDMQKSFQQSLRKPIKEQGFGLSETLSSQKVLGEEGLEFKHGIVAIAAITSCTNTANPYLMIGAGLMARNVVNKGLKVKSYVKTSFAPGSQVVVQYLRAAGLLGYLEQLGFNVVGFGCTTCVGNSGAINASLTKAIVEHNLIATAILSGNRNFEGRIHPLVKASYLASPVHVISYSLAGNVDFDFTQTPLGQDQEGKNIYLSDILPEHQQVQAFIDKFITKDLYQTCYQKIFAGTKEWQELKAPEGALYAWDHTSTYIKYPPFFENIDLTPQAQDIANARVLLKLGDSITTDHISPVGPIAPNSPAGQYLLTQGVKVQDLNVYGARRGNHEVMLRGTFANARLMNLIAPEAEGWFTCFFPNNEILNIYDAAMLYQQSHIPLIILAGKNYGTGSARDWAAKGTALLGVKAVIAESFERIHRSNLVGMGVLPLQFLPNENSETLELKGDEIYTIHGLNNLNPRQMLEVTVMSAQGRIKCFAVRLRLENEMEVDYYKCGGIFPKVLVSLRN